MKKILVMFTMMMVAMVTFAKDIKTVVFTTTPQMHCAACENKIKSNLRFEKGIKSIETSVPDQTDHHTECTEQVLRHYLIVDEIPETRYSSAIGYRFPYICHR